MGKAWSDEAIRHLLDWRSCPQCEFTTIVDAHCTNCGADLSGEAAVTLAAASKAAAAALTRREELVATIPIGMPARAPAAANTFPSYVSPVPPEPSADPRTSSQISVQSILAVAGAGLFAIAAIVFSFFNPDLTDDTVRYSIVAAITLLFLGAAWLLARARLQFSAEAIAALGMVFVVIDIWAISTRTNTGMSDYANAAITTIVISAIMIGLATLRRMRAWLWTGTLGLVATPLLLGLAGADRWSIAFGWLGLGLVALGVHELLHVAKKRFDSELAADHGTAIVLQFLSVGAVIVQIPFLPDGDTAARVLFTAFLLAVLGGHALLATRNGLTQIWGYIAGVMLTAAVAVLPFAPHYLHDEWLLALVPAAAFATATAVTSVSLMVRRTSTIKVPLLAGVLSVSFLAATPAAAMLTLQLLTPTLFWVDAVTGISAIIGLASGAIALAIIAAGRRSSALAAVATCFGVASVAGLATWAFLPDVTRVVLTLAVAVAFAAALVWLLARRKPGIRIPLFVGAHILIVLAAVISGTNDELTTYGGIGVVAAVAALAVAMPRVTRPFYTAAGFAYALGVFIFTLRTFTVLDDDAVLNLNTALAALVAITVTLISRIPRAYWYAVLAVSAVPFVLTIGFMLVRISGWVGLSTGVVVVLAMILVTGQRPGHTAFLRGLAAALLVPGLSVVIISEFAQLLPRSASPITLPIIAALVAATLPVTGLVGRLLVQRGHEESSARAVRLLLEISALVTGAVAVALAVVRPASGLLTTFLVFAIIGVGAAATGQFVHRRYAWIVAFISFTGALWSLLGLNKLDTVELYVLPPALAAAVIGVIAIGRGRRGLGFYAIGLGIAAVTPLIMLSARGNPPAWSLDWRTYGPLAASVLLIVIGVLLGRVTPGSRFANLGQLRVATLLVALGSATSGVIQAVRFGTRLDATSFAGDSVLVPVLAFSLVAVALAALSAWLIAGASLRLARSRWLYVPAALFLVVGPIASFRHGDAYSWTLLTLTTLELALLIVTVVRGRSHAVTLPPVWATFAIATAAGIAGWSEHSVFRVEAFSLTLGLALLAAGVIAARPVKDAVGTITSWPIAHSGSWRLLAPGILVTLSPSVMATGTDPQTWRAILVIALALVGILIGNRRKLAAPFLIGIAALPVEILIVFAVQIGKTIQPTTWYITLATAGAVLLVIAVSSERNSSGDRGVGARLRDLK